MDLTDRLLRLSNQFKQTVQLLMDVFLVAAALTAALYLRFDWNIPLQYLGRLENLLLPAVLINLAIFVLFGLYRRLWRYASLYELKLILAAVCLGAAGTYGYSIISGQMLPRSVYIIYGLLLLLLLGGSRLSLRVLYGKLKRRPADRGRRNVLIIGAGDAGVQVAGELKKSQERRGARVVGFVDDDSAKQGQVIQGIPVLGGREAIPRLLEKQPIHEVVFAIPSASYGTLRHFFELCSRQEVQMKTVPGLFDILEGKVSLSHLKEVEIEDLLRRPPVEVDVEAISDYLANKTVLITGAAGSIGSELCRQVALMGPQKLLLLDNNEDGLFHIHRELESRNFDCKLYHLVGDVRDYPSLEKVFDTFRPDVVFHAAAYKHVPLMEYNAEEAVRNNVLGSKHVMDLAEAYRVSQCVAISTDKAVYPKSVMGTTKRVAELYLQHRARRNGSCSFCAVRFGNVLGSRGSVVTLFREQIAKGGPVTVTHPAMTRYFMTIPEAVQLIIQAGALGQRGEIFVLDMGEPLKILDLACDMIHLSGLQPWKDIEITYTGIRPGEKLAEDLFNEREAFLRTEHERIFIAPDCLDNELAAEQELKELGRRLEVDLKSLLGLQERAEQPGERERERERDRVEQPAWLKEMGAG